MAKNLRLLIAAVVLTFALTAPVAAGDIHTMATEPPPPSATSSMITEGETGATVAGDIHTMNSDEMSASSAIIETALHLLRSVLPLF